ncbi:MAG: hypothetical protein CL920_22295 [Deltaproteobacteria bacterium]|nr:hypothetical protein [Deltaproteobacteria bacterium]
MSTPFYSVSIEEVKDDNITIFVAPMWLETQHTLLPSPFHHSFFFQILCQELPSERREGFFREHFDASFDALFDESWCLGHADKLVARVQLMSFDLYPSEDEEASSDVRGIPHAMYCVHVRDKEVLSYFTEGGCYETTAYEILPERLSASDDLAERVTLLEEAFTGRRVGASLLEGEEALCLEALRVSDDDIVRRVLAVLEKYCVMTKGMAEVIAKELPMWDGTGLWSWAIEASMWRPHEALAQACALLTYATNGEETDAIVGQLFSSWSSGLDVMRGLFAYEAASLFDAEVLDEWELMTLIALYRVEPTTNVLDCIRRHWRQVAQEAEYYRSCLMLSLWGLFETIEPELADDIFFPDPPMKWFSEAFYEDAALAWLKSPWGVEGLAKYMVGFVSYLRRYEVSLRGDEGEALRAGYIRDGVDIEDVLLSCLEVFVEAMWEGLQGYPAHHEALLDLLAARLDENDDMIALITGHFLHRAL